MTTEIFNFIFNNKKIYILIYFAVIIVVITAIDKKDMQLLRIASVLFFLHICYHPRLYVSSAPIKDSFNSDISDNAEEEIQTHSNDEHDNAVTKIFNSTTFANITNSLLRSDSYNTTNAFDLSTKRSMPYVIWISMKSWEKYHTFLRETCRTIKEETPKFGGQDVLENGYFKWEENEFHRELRVLLFPETSNTLKPLVDNGMIDKLDKRFLQKPLESFCYRKEAKHTKEEAIADEKAKFEDIVLNRIYPQPWMRQSFEMSISDSNETLTTPPPTTMMMMSSTTTNFPTTSVPFFDITISDI